MGEVLNKRREFTDTRLAELNKLLEDSEVRYGDRACVYLTGSYARGEASEFSDLDLFILGKQKDDGERAFSRLDEICLKADLIDGVRKLRFPEFSGDGEYLVHYTVGELKKEIGTPHDDAKNTFTARLLLLLESRLMLGADVYRTAIDGVIEAYWRDYAKHKSDFMPSYLSNDILRLWRTFCVNYEARTKSETDEQKAKRRLKNYKLKHSRLLTCYSAIASLLSVHNSKKTVSPDDVREIVSRTPSQRLEQLESEYKSEVEAILNAYERFLDGTNAKEEELVGKFMDAAHYHPKFADAQRFGDSVFALLNKLGNDGDYFRHLVV